MVQNHPKVRVRFAPSPTGFVHVGSLRTALYNYLFARKHKGDFVLRIEDTDRQRLASGAVDNLLDTLKKCGLGYDEGPEKEGPYGPYFQSHRLELYSQYADKLLRQGAAYRCFCTENRLDQLREEQINRKETPRYDGKCRHLSYVTSDKRAANEAFVIRMKIPERGITMVQDIIRGTVRFKNEVLDDQVLLKSDGFPTYHLANVVDDHLMKISHVIRGEEWLLSTPKHVLLYEYFSWPCPEFAHLPLLLNPDRSKLSKRQGDVAVEEYLQKGYLPQALLNFIALLGWNRGDDQEVFSLEEMISSFTLERVNKSGAVFDSEKLNWLNGVYIRQMNEDEYVEQATGFLNNQGVNVSSEDQIRSILLAVRKGISTYSDIHEHASLFFNDRIEEYSSEARQWLQKEETARILNVLVEEARAIDELNLNTFRQLMQNVQQKTGVKGKDLWMPVRAAITGTTEGPELAQVIEILGKERIIDFIEQVL